MVVPVAPLDPFHTLTDPQGRITREWYSWLSLLCSRLAVPGLTTFTGGTSMAVDFTNSGMPDQPDTSYMVIAETTSNVNIWVTAKTTTGFTLTSSSALTGPVRWTLVKY